MSGGNQYNGINVQAKGEIRLSISIVRSLFQNAYKDIKFSIYYNDQTGEILFIPPTRSLTGREDYLKTAVFFMIHHCRIQKRELGYYFIKLPKGIKPLTGRYNFVSRANTFEYQIHSIYYFRKV